MAILENTKTFRNKELTDFFINVLEDGENDGWAYKSVGCSGSDLYTIEVFDEEGIFVGNI